MHTCLQSVQSWFNIYDVILLVLLLSAIVTQILQNSTGAILNSKASVNHKQFLNLSMFIKWSTMSDIFLSLSIFFVSIRLIRPLAFSRWISQNLMALNKMRPEIFSFLPLFFLIFLSFSMLFNLLLSRSLFHFRTFFNTLMTLFSCILGKSKFGTGN